MIVVRLIRNKYTGEWYYSPVNAFSFRWLGKLAPFGCHWFYPNDWQYVAGRAAEHGLKLTNRWYHIQRCAEEGFNVYSED